jgi:hypothetical protein
MGIRGGRQAPLTTLKLLPFQKSQFRGTEHWNTVPKNVTTTQTPTTAANDEGQPPILRDRCEVTDEQRQG